MSMSMSVLRSAASRVLPQEISIICSAHCSSRQAIRSFSSTSRRSSSSASASTDSGLITPHKLSFPDLPKFKARGSDVQVLTRPDQFYNFLLDGIRDAKKRIFLASLYIGKEETGLVQTLHRALKANPSLELHIITDFLRSTREHPTSTSSASLIASLQASFPSQVHLSLYHTPALHGFLKRIIPKRYNEGWGLWHGKIYGFDDDLMLSGANLSKDYFTNRQDRYIVFKNHPRLADYMHDLMKTFKELSYGIKGRSTAIGSDNFDLVWHGGSDGPDAEPIKDPRGFTECAKKCLGSFMSRWLKTLSSSSSSSPSSATQEFDTTIQPFLQMGQFDITQETDVVVPAILEQIQQDERLRLDWTSGYFGVRKAYKEGLLQTKGPVHIVCASPEANGFFQSPGFSKYIPPAYTYAESQFWQATKSNHQSNSIVIDEWKREGWTYHSKGIWLSPTPSSGSSTTSGSSTSKEKDEEALKPYLTLIGSSNYGYRSAVRDVEVNAVVQTSSLELRKALGEEISNIRQHANDTVNDELFMRKDRRVGPINKLAARIIADML